ncbi:hypothetical protein FJZ18_02830 [Candidatus Pacearchaeota archaeon]|nr:hypothetical protein [Candidatus Pacearchaeota archaeon]
MDGYSKLVERVATASGLPVEEIERKVEAKRAKLSGLVSKEGACQIVASELGINFDKERIKISELVEGMKRANVLGKVFQVFPVRTYTKAGREGKVASFMIADEGGSVRIVLWDVNHISLVEQGKVQEGEVIEISHGSVRNGELHLSSFGDIKISKEQIAQVKVERNILVKSLKDARPGQSLKTRAVVVQVFDPRYFEVCPECGKKVVEEECAVHGKVTPQRRALLSIVLDDGTETMRAVLFSEQIKSLGIDDETVFSLEKFAEYKKHLLGEEKVFSGTVKSNSLYNTIDFTIQGVEEVDPQTLIKELEAKA